MSHHPLSLVIKDCNEVVFKKGAIKVPITAIELIGIYSLTIEDDALDGIVTVYQHYESREFWHILTLESLF
jgi:hypothetical protein